MAFPSLKKAVDVASLLAKSWFSSSEGQWRGPFMGRGELNGWYPLDPHEDGWQRNLVLNYDLMQSIPAVAGAVHLHASAGAQLRPSVNHYDDERNVSENRKSAAARVLINPNPYETGSEFQARCFSYVVQDGMACIVGLRNARFEVAQIYVIEPKSWTLYIDPETKVPFVLISQDGILTKIEDATMMVPMRDVFIFKWGTSRRNPLLGQAPLEAAGIAAAIYAALSRSQAAFFNNMRRPSGALITDEILSLDQMRQLREAFDDQAKAMQSGGIPILAGGLKWNPMSITSQDAEVIETLKMSIEEIARAVGVPPPLLGQLDNATLSNVEQLISHWMSVSLGGLIERYERGLDRLFGLDSVKDRIEMDTTALLRTDFAERMQSYGRAIQGGVMTPNEVRRKEGLSPVPGGDEVFLQRQMTSVSLITELNQAELTEPAQQPEPEPDDMEDDDTETDDQEEKYLALQAELGDIRKKLSGMSEKYEHYDDETTALIVRDAINKAMEAEGGIHGE